MHCHRQGVKRPGRGATAAARRRACGGWFAAGHRSGHARLLGRMDLNTRSAASAHSIAVSGCFPTTTQRTRGQPAATGALRRLGDDDVSSVGQHGHTGISGATESNTVILLGPGVVPQTTADGDRILMWGPGEIGSGYCRHYRVQFSNGPISLIRLRMMWAR
jgi:hypothetical protein